jgi:predicted dehydrogenase/threonine dehydrogenase-like Zn-dependent dehydrogenase
VKQVAQNYKSGELLVLDVPAPACRPGGVLVRSLFSLISTGTEMMKVGEAKLSLLGKARARPDQLRKVVDAAAQLGPAEAYKRAVTRLDSFTPLGYSLSGIVEQVGDGVDDFTVGQLVACAGNDHALHAEVNWVPRNLCVPVADGVAPEHAAFATVGAIAMHGIRRGEMQLGETACVIGLGLVGQLAVQLLVASGIRVVGFDIVPQRCRVAEAAGAVACAAPDAEGIARIGAVVGSATAGLGADTVFIAAGGSSNDPVHIAAAVARDRARVVDIGKTRLDLPWNDYYDKELDVRFSRSYGPGRYDDRYELEGIDYPSGYVRWTERRNLACFVELLERDVLPIDLLVSGSFPVEDATDVYARLADHTLDGIGFLFEYPAGRDAVLAAANAPAPVPQSSGPHLLKSLATGPLRVGFVGAGNYATSSLLPALRDDERVTLRRVATARSLSAANAQRRFGFTEAATGADSVLDDDDIDVVFVATRHHSHADLACRALERGKAVFVEKPLALSDDEVERVLEVVERTGNDRLMVGFNRRFAPLFAGMKERFGVRASAGTARYLVNAGPLAAGSWYANEALEGSRFVGEGGHFIDTLSWWFDASPVSAHATKGPAAGDVHATLEFDNESVATITYVTGGNARVPKETFDASGGGRSARLNNFRSAEVWKGRRRRVIRSIARVDKGQRGELDAFLGAVRRGASMPIPLESLVTTTRATLAVARGLSSGQRETW